MGYMARKAAAVLALVAGFNATRKSQQVATKTAFGSFTLATGAYTVSLAGVTAQSTVVLTLVTPGGTMGNGYKVVPSAGQFIVTAIDASGSLVNTDTSAFNYRVDTPLFHADATPQTSTGDASEPATTALAASSATATNLATSIALANELRQVYTQHIADAVGHLVADDSNALEEPIADDLTTVEALANDIKAKFNAHLTESGVHVHDDAVNTVSTTDASDQSTANALLNALKTAINAHLASAPTGGSVTLVGP